MYKHDLVLNNQKWLICHKTKPNKLLRILSQIKNKEITVLFFPDFSDLKLGKEV